MRAFEVHLNGKRLCVAGVGDDGVLTAIVDHVRGDGRDELQLGVSGLECPSGDHLTWTLRRLRAGDEISVRIVEAGAASRPRHRTPRDPAAERQAEEQYVRELARQWGWRIIVPEPGTNRAAHRAARSAGGAQ
jgi:hypothetical protein